MAKISGRNKIPGKVREVRADKVMAQVIIDGPGGIELVAVITRDSADALGLKKGKRVTALIKATEIMVIDE